MLKKRCNTSARLIILLATLPLLHADDLHQAVQAGKLEQVKLAIARGAGINTRDELGATPLHDAVWNGQLEIARYMIEHGADIRARHAEGGSQPLGYACIKNDLPMAELLIARGADVKATDNSGETPLHVAAAGG